MNDVNLDQVAVSLKERFPKCKEQIDKELARIRKEQEELADSGKRGESVHMLAMDFRAYIQNLPCAEYGPVKKKQRSSKGAKKGPFGRGQSSRR